MDWVGINYFLTALSMHGCDAQGRSLLCITSNCHLWACIITHYLFLEQFAHWISCNLCTYTVIKCTARIARSL